MGLSYMEPNSHLYLISLELKLRYAATNIISSSSTMNEDMVLVEKFLKQRATKGLFDSVKAQLKYVNYTINEIDVDLSNVEGHPLNKDFTLIRIDVVESELKAKTFL